MGSLHPSPNVKTLCNFEPQIWPEIITSRDAKNACFKGSRSCDVILVAHDCGYPVSRYTCRATRVAADFLDFIAFCRCSTGVALHPLKILVSHLPPPCAGRCRTEIWV